MFDFFRFVLVLDFLCGGDIIKVRSLGEMMVGRFVL